GRRRSSYPYPPGPTRLPILGNLHQFPTHDEWVTYDKWCKEIGSDIIYLRAAGMEFVVLNSLEAITDLLQKRSSIYSSRCANSFRPLLMGWTWMLLGIEYGQTWKEQRRIFTRYFHSKSPSVYQPKHIAFLRGMLPGLLNTPEDFFEITKHAVHGSAISMAYGLPVQQRDDPYVDLAERSTNSLNRAVLPGNFLINIIPALRYVPEFFPG
ncbi:cytochrome P450, partial [Agrocybe pediades]